MSKRAKFFALGNSDRLMLLHAYALLWRTWFGLRVASFARLRAAANGSAIHVSPADQPPSQRLTWAIVAMSRYVPGGDNCLLRAVAAGRMLRRYGYDAALQIGVAKGENGALAAHAWLESGGEVVIGGFELDRYVALDTMA